MAFLLGAGVEAGHHHHCVKDEEAGAASVPNLNEALWNCCQGEGHLEQKMCDVWEELVSFGGRGDAELFLRLQHCLDEIL